MIKKIILEIFLIVITAIALVCGYYLIIDIESSVPQDLSKVNVETREFMDRKVFSITPKDNKEVERTIIYFHGGAYVAEATNSHWKFLEKLANDTKSNIIMPDYPLTPKYYYKDVLKMIEPLYKETLERVGADKIIVMGDSAGGGMALGLLEKLSKSNIDMPAKTILISPWLDTTMSNPKIDEIQKNDKDLNKEKLLLAGKMYSREISNGEEYFVNPLYGELSKLKNIILYTGTYDILNPDCHTLQEKAKEVGVDVEVREYETAPHIWIVNNEDELAISAYNNMISDILN